MLELKSNIINALCIGEGEVFPYGGIFTFVDILCSDSHNCNANAKAALQKLPVPLE